MERIYTVQTGDNLSLIAKHHLGEMDRWKEIAFINGLAHPYVIYPGQILQLPPDKPSVVEIEPIETESPASEPLRITVAGRKPSPKPVTASTVNPATVKLIAVIGLGLFLLSRI